MSGAHSISTRRAYGVQRVCRVWGLRPLNRVRARRQGTPPRSRRPSPRAGRGRPRRRSWSTHIRRVLEASPFHGEGYRQAWAKLRVERHPHVEGAGAAVDARARPPSPVRAWATRTARRRTTGPSPPQAPDVMWGTDMTSTVTVGEGATCVFVAVDHCTTECIGLHAAKRGTRFEALEPIRQGVRERFGPISDGVARGLRLRHDHRLELPG